MSQNIKAPKKLIEVALPLDDINVASAREKSIRHGHPSTLHLWWARRPLAAARAVLFAQLVNDPGGERGWYTGKTKAQADEERERLFDIIRDLVKWENTNNETVLERARAAIRASWRETCELNKGKPGFDPEKLPAFHDPFAGGGSIPLEAQRLGLEAHASDLNPVAVLINKAMIEIPPRFAGRAPVGPIPEGPLQYKLDREDWPGATGLAEDVRRYGHWMREEAFKRIGHLYPPVEVTAEMANDPSNPRPDLKSYVGKKLTVIAWIWARTVKSPNPAFAHVDVPLVSSFLLSTKKSKEAYVEPVIENDRYRFTVRLGEPKNAATRKNGTRAGKAQDFLCLLSGVPVSRVYIRDEGKAGRLGDRLMAIVAEGDRGRVYISPTDAHERIAQSAADFSMVDEARNTFLSSATPTRAMITGGVCSAYGLSTWGHLFSPRQLVALITFSDLVTEALDRIEHDYLKALTPSPFADEPPNPQNEAMQLRCGGSGAKAYAEAIGVYLSMAVSKETVFLVTQARWRPGEDKSAPAFGRQAFPMVWDYADLNPFAGAGGDFLGIIDGTFKTLRNGPQSGAGFSDQEDASCQSVSFDKIVSTDPPYYDNIGYADLSDFFYVWLRRSLKSIFPDLFATLVVPKAEELVATLYRHGSKEKAEAFFLSGMTQAMSRLAEQTHPAFPITIYYAFKQSETSNDTGTASTGWETFLDAVRTAGLAVNGTWPIRTESSSRLIGMVTNALASSIVLVCRKRDPDAPSISRRDFQRELRDEMPEALETMIGGKLGASPIAPVDLAQAAIGPGMAIYSKYAAVLEADGSPMPVHNALVMINKAIEDFLNPNGAGFDADTLFCSAWFDQLGWATGKFGDADTLARAKGTSVDGVAHSGVVESGGGNVRLLRWDEYPRDWDPTQDNRTPVWEAIHQVIRALNQQGESAAGALLARMPERGDQIRQLAYHLYTLCERKKWADDARAYNELIAAWHGIVTASHETGHIDSQGNLDL
ncbi:DUF1156 domain-containing protein [uncultured Thiodictyon sp.]|uniref:DUF1156 domain-containing protein n=1 Tax=uncultured Thiodictyon sp. TaxID=1846217 RepID=UPI0025DB6CF7|nr:DUF1156 domain-containing protein [uncultured Thiodictyon sp.]